MNCSRFEERFIGAIHVAMGLALRIVMKTPANVYKDLVDVVGKFRLRVCRDYRAANSQIVKIVPNLFSGLEEVEKAVGHSFTGRGTT
jgi:hypothetical protein